MIDTAQNCFKQAAISDSAAEGPMLENVRRKHLASAAAWKSLGAMLVGRVGDRHALPLSKRAEPLSARPRKARQRPAVAEGWENEGGAS